MIHKLIYPSVERRSGRKYYTFIVGKINVPKLANFAEIDVFVYVACPENSTIDSKVENVKIVGLCASTRPRAAC